MKRPEFITDITPAEGWKIVKKLLAEASKDIFIEPGTIAAVKSRVPDEDIQKLEGKDTTVSQAGNKPKR